MIRTWSDDYNGRRCDLYTQGALDVACMIGSIEAGNGVLVWMFLMRCRHRHYTSSIWCRQPFGVNGERRIVCLGASIRKDVVQRNLYIQHHTHEMQIPSGFLQFNIGIMNDDSLAAWRC